MYGGLTETKGFPRHSCRCRYLCRKGLLENPRRIASNRPSYPPVGTYTMYGDVLWAETQTLTATNDDGDGQESTADSPVGLTHNTVPSSQLKPSSESTNKGRRKLLFFLLAVTALRALVITRIGVQHFAESILPEEETPPGTRSSNRGCILCPNILKWLWETPFVSGP